MLPAPAIDAERGIKPKAFGIIAMSEEGFARMNGFSRSRIVLPLISLAFAFSAYAEEPNHGQGGHSGQKGPPPQSRPAVQATRPGLAPQAAPMHAAPMHAQGGHPPGVMPGRGPGP